MNWYFFATVLAISSLWFKIGQVKFDNYLREFEIRTTDSPRTLTIANILEVIGAALFFIGPIGALITMLWILLMLLLDLFF